MYKCLFLMITSCRSELFTHKEIKDTVLLTVCNSYDGIIYTNNYHQVLHSN